MGFFYITLLGRFTAGWTDRDPLPLTPARPGALLAFLALEADKVHSRIELAEWFWPEQAQDQALASLRFTLSNLRRLFNDRQASQPILVLTRKDVQINPKLQVEVDVIQFEKMAQAALAAHTTSSEHQAGIQARLIVLRQALDHYPGVFMRDFSFGSQAVESWALKKRARLGELHNQVLQVLGSTLESDEQFLEAAHVYQQALENNPWDEHLHRQVIRSFQAGGQPSAALAQYEQCRKLLRELGVEPDWETNRLYHQIKAAQYTDARPYPAVLVGRKDEMEWMAAHLKRSLVYQGDVLLIAGESGSGKTALLRQFARQAMSYHPDLLVVSGQCDAFAGKGQPYQPFFECLQMLSGEWEKLSWSENLDMDSKKRLALALPDIARVLVSTAPELLSNFVGRKQLTRKLKTLRTANAKEVIPALLPDIHQAERRLTTPLIYEQLKSFLISLSQQTPLVLLLDDMHWADPDSTALLFYLARHLQSQRILIVITYRPEELGEGQLQPAHPLAACIHELQRYRRNIHLDLDQANEQRFVAAWLAEAQELQPHNLSPAFRAALARHTGGNPLFTLEILESLRTQVDLSRSSDGVWQSRPEIRWDHLPERVEAAIASRVQALPASWHEWLSTASIEGASFTAEVIAEIHNLDLETVLQTLNGPLSMGRGAQHMVQAEGVEWLEVEPGRHRSLSRYRFRHTVLQTYLYQALNPVENSRRHAAVALALERLYANSPALSRRAGELAHHFEISGLFEKAATYCLQAGRYAISLASSQSAMAHYNRGLELLDKLPFTSSRRNLEINLYLALGMPFLAANEWGSAERRQYIQKALDLLEGYSGENDPELLSALFSQADFLISQGELEQAARIGEQMLDLAAPDNHLGKAMAYRILGFSRTFQGDFVAGKDYIEATLRLLAQAGHAPSFAPNMEPLCHAILGMTLAFIGCSEQAWQHTRRAINQARLNHQLGSLGGVLIFASEVAILHCNWPLLAQYALEMKTLKDVSDLRYFQAYVLAVNGYAQVVRAESTHQEAWAGLKQIQRGLQLWQTTSTRTGLGQWSVRLADSYLRLGQIADGLAVTTRGLQPENLRFAGIGLSQLYCLQGRLLLAQQQPNPIQAEASFQKALEIARQQGAHTLALRAAIQLARLWANSQPEKGQHLLAEVCAGFTTPPDCPDWHKAQTIIEALRV